MEEVVSFNYIVKNFRRLGIAEHRRRAIIKRYVTPVYDTFVKKTVYDKQEVDNIIQKLQSISQNYKNVSEISEEFGWSRCKVRAVVKKHDISSVGYPLVVRTSYNLKELKLFLFPKKVQVKTGKFNGRKFINFIGIHCSSGVLGRAVCIARSWYVLFKDGSLTPFSQFYKKVYPDYPVLMTNGVIHRQGREARQKFGIDLFEKPDLKFMFDFLLRNAPRNTYYFENLRRHEGRFQGIILHVISSEFTLNSNSETNASAKRFVKIFNIAFKDKCECKMIKDIDESVVLKFMNIEPSLYISVPLEVHTQALKLAKRKDVRVANLYSQIIEKNLR